MVFKRRDRRPFYTAILRFLWPRGGWGRAAQYVKHRVRRLPDTPEKIGRGVWAGVFAAFTPFYGLHFIVAALMAKLMRGNLIAALLGTFFGNPLTYVPIGVAAMETGYWLLGMRPEAGLMRGIGQRFGAAFADLRHNFLAIFTDARADWEGLAQFYREIFLPYFFGGIIPGIVAATACYYLVVPLIAAYQNRRRKLLREKLGQLKKTTAPVADQTTDGSEGL